MGAPSRCHLCSYWASRCAPVFGRSYIKAIRIAGTRPMAHWQSLAAGRVAMAACHQAASRRAAGEGWCQTAVAVAIKRRARAVMRRIYFARQGAMRVASDVLAPPSMGKPMSKARVARPLRPQAARVPRATSTTPTLPSRPVYLNYTYYINILEDAYGC